MIKHPFCSRHSAEPILQTRRMMSYFYDEPGRSVRPYKQRCVRRIGPWYFEVQVGHYHKLRYEDD